MAALVFFLLCVGAFLTLGMRKAPLVAWAVAVGVLTWLAHTGLFGGGGYSSILTAILSWLPFTALAALSVPSLRRSLITAPAYSMVRGILPKVSDTEAQALEAGTVGFDAELFSGTPDWNKLQAIPPIQLSAEEQAFLDGPTEELCKMINDWQVRHANREIPEPIWAFVKKHGFLGMLISKDHGGFGFSAQAQSLILGKIASRSPDVVTIVMVPNSLGPGELIEKYGTDQQKHYFLPRLAKGEEVPCFSLTGPTSGSDAATMRDIGTVTKGQHEGKETLGIRLSWDKRYITLGPKATLVGLAFRLFDPENLLGKGEDIGITLALIPATASGVNIGRRHLPSGAAFPNGPNWGNDVFIPIDWVIGGEKMAGAGWRMLMECLSAGRAISLPSSATSGAKMMLRVTQRLCPHQEAVRPSRLAHGRRRRTPRAHHRDGLRQRSRARHDGGDGLPRRKAGGDFGADEIPDDGKTAPRRQRRHGHSRRPRHLRRARELSAIRLSDGPRRHHGRRREHSDAHADHVSRRARCARIPSSTRKCSRRRIRIRSAGSKPSKRRSAATSPFRCRMRPAPSCTT